MQTRVPEPPQLARRSGSRVRHILAAPFHPIREGRIGRQTIKLRQYFVCSIAFRRLMGRRQRIFAFQDGK
jgi:hypothetical protein